MTFRQQKPRVILMVNDGCNNRARCKKCYLPRFGRMEPLEALSITKGLRAKGYDVFPGGGELLTEPAYLECHAAAGQTYLLTNGILLANDQAPFEVLRTHGIRQVVFSLDFELATITGSVPERIVREAIRRSLNEGFEVAVSTLITAFNFRSLPSYCEQAVEMGASVLNLYRYIRIHQAALDPDFVLPDYDLHEFFDIWRKEKARWDKKLQIELKIGFGPTPNLLAKLKAAGRNYCPAGEMIFAVTPDKRVYGCFGLVIPGMEIGELVDGDIRIHSRVVGDRDKCLGTRFGHVRIEPVP